jgi:hypothetical protein
VNEDIITKTARLTHEMNRRWCQLIGDDSQVAWEDAPEWQRSSAIAGVRAVLEGSATTPEEQHQCWLDTKMADGWMYGTVKSAISKTHPCIVPYAELPPEQRAKDAIFRAVVASQLDTQE